MPRVTLDLSALASGLVVKNRPQARAYKSNITRRAIQLINYYLLLGMLCMTEIAMLQMITTKCIV